jgi:hypothetical protein
MSVTNFCTLLLKYHGVQVRSRTATAWQQRGRRCPSPGAQRAEAHAERVRELILSLRDVIFGGGIIEGRFQLSPPETFQPPPPETFRLQPQRRFAFEFFLFPKGPKRTQKLAQKIAQISLGNSVRDLAFVHKHIGYFRVTLTSFARALTLRSREFMIRNKRCRGVPAGHRAIGPSDHRMDPAAMQQPASACLLPGLTQSLRLGARPLPPSAGGGRPYAQGRGWVARGHGAGPRTGRRRPPCGSGAGCTAA